MEWAKDLFKKIHESWLCWYWLEWMDHISQIIWCLLLCRGMWISNAQDCPAIKSCYNPEHRKSSRNHSRHPRTLLCSWQNELTQCPVLRWEQKRCFKGISQYVGWNLRLPISSYKHIFNETQAYWASAKWEINPLVLMNECKPTVPLQKAWGETKTIHVLYWKDMSYCHHLSFIFIFQEFNFYKYLLNPPSQDTRPLERNLSVKFSIIKGLKYVFICYFSDYFISSVNQEDGKWTCKGRLILEYHFCTQIKTFCLKHSYS